MSCVAVIPARGGSKRIPRKNIKEFLGKPIIAYTIETALASGLFDEVMVSTDDEEIAAVAVKFGASVPFMRSKKMADDFATADQVMIEVLDEYETRGKTFEYFACLYPTAPFITSDRLREGMELMRKYNPAAVMPLVRFSYPPQRSYRVDDEGRASFIDVRYIESRSQDLEPMYHEIGQYYFFNVKKYREAGGIIKNDIMAIIVGENEAQDIDTEEDWKIAELKYRIINGLGNLPG